MITILSFLCVFFSLMSKRIFNFQDKETKLTTHLETLADVFAIFENGLNPNEQSCILIWEGRFYGMGYISSDVQLSDPEELKNFLTPYKENLFIRNLVNGYAARFPEKVKLFSSLAIQSSH